MKELISLADYGVGLFSIAALLWVCGQVFTVIKSNTCALQELIVLIREQSAVVRDLALEVRDLKTLSRKD